MKVVINTMHGGFGLSHEAMLRYCELKGLTVYPEPLTEFAGMQQTYVYWTVPAEDRICISDLFDQKGKEISKEEYNDLVNRANTQSIDDYSIDRNDPALIQVIEEMGEESWGSFAELSIVEIPDDVKWHIAEYDGREWIAEDHRTWP